MKTKTRCKGGFTLTEILVAGAVMAGLAMLGFSMVGTAMEKARMVTEVASARNLMTAYHSYASDHGGELLPGYRQEDDVTNLNGRPLHHPVSSRYPWKIAPYVGSMARGVVFNGNEKLLEQSNADYRVSVAPNLGINAVFVGGHFGSGSPLAPGRRILEVYGKFYVSRSTEVIDPSRLLVFASARSEEGEGGVGYFEVRPPRVTGTLWSGKPFESDSEPADYGFVDFRWGGKAVVAMFGGNVELMDEDALRDMRYWSNQASEEDDPDFRVGSNN